MEVGVREIPDTIFPPWKHRADLLATSYIDGRGIRVPSSITLGGEHGECVRILAVPLRIARVRIPDGIAPDRVA
jgi:hypothetical protein